jgi:hypothetical protein
MKQIIIIGTLLCAFATSASAVDLSINQDQQILMPDGKPHMICDDLDSLSIPPKCLHTVPKTVGLTIQSVLITQLPDPSGRGNDPGNAKSGNLAIRIYGQQHPVMTHEEYQLILSRVDRIEDPITIARMHEFLEPLTKP